MIGRTRANGQPAQSARETREQVLAAAERLFAYRGYHGVSTVAIAEAAGIRSATLFYYFRSKREILTTLCARGFVPCEPELQREFGTKGRQWPE